MPPINCKVDLGIALYPCNSDLMDLYIMKIYRLYLGRKLQFLFILNRLLKYTLIISNDRFHL